MGVGAGNIGLADGERICLKDGQAAGIFRLKLRKRGYAAAVALDRRNRRSGIEQRAREAARAGTHLINALAFERTWNGRDPSQELTVEDEILSERLACAKAVAGNDLAERLCLAAQAASARRIALCAAIRIAAAIGRGSARSCPAMSNAVPWSGAVRTIGRPSVTFTASSKWSALIGISA